MPDSDIEKTDDIENARYYQGETSFTEKELRRTSKEQKIQFYGADKNTLLNEIDDISEIAQYLNGLALEQWEYADNAPNPEEVECQIVRFMLSRDNKKELKEMYTEILYKSNGNYYIEEIIPGEYSDRGNNANFSFRFVEGESLLIMLDGKGICGSSGSACTSGSLDPSHVLLAIGLPHEIAHGSLRLTLSEETTKEDVDYVVDSLKEIVGKLRNMSPLYEDFIKKEQE